LLPFWGYNAGKALQPQSIIVDVSGNRSQADSLATIAGGLDKAGFGADSVESRQTVGQTTITYGPAGFDAALTLATHLQDTPKMVFDETIVGPRLVLGVPRDFGGLRDQPIPVDQLPALLRIPPKQLSTTTTTVADPSTSTTSTVVATSETPAAPGAPAPGAPGAPAPATGAGPSTSIPADSSGQPGFLEGSDNATSPGVVPTDPVKAAACR